jgi:hypothetical protein
VSLLQSRHGTTVLIGYSPDDRENTPSGRMCKLGVSACSCGKRPFLACYGTRVVYGVLELAAGGRVAELADQAREVAVDLGRALALVAAFFVSEVVGGGVVGRWLAVGRGRDRGGGAADSEAGDVAEQREGSGVAWVDVAEHRSQVGVLLAELVALSACGVSFSAEIAHSATNQ